MSIKHLYEDERPTLLLDFANSKTLDPRITFERLSVGTYVDELGIIKTAADNEARFDHDPATGECRGLLIEEERTNYITNSTDFSTANGDWNVTSQGTSPGFPTVTPASGIAPDGTNTASRLQASTGGGTGGGDQAYISSLRDSSTRAAVSVYMKSNTGSNQTIFGTFDTQPVVVTPQWQRFTGDSNDYRIGVRGSISDADIDILIWGAQVEEGNKGSSFCTSYIPTSGSTVQRLVDEVSITGTNVTDFYNNSESTFFYERVKQNTVQNQQEFWIGPSPWSQNNNISPVWQTNSQTQLQIKTANVWQSFSTVSNTADKVAFALKNNDTVLAAGGVLGNVVTSITLPSSVAYINIRPGSLIKRIAYYNTRLSDTALEALTK